MINTTVELTLTLDEPEGCDDDDRSTPPPTTPQRSAMKTTIEKSEDNPTPAERWEQGMAHDPRSVQLYEAISHFDFEYNDDYFYFKNGGDGDNGEHLMYLLDMYFHELDCRDDETEEPT